MPVTNTIESTFATVRLRTDKTKDCLSRDTALAMVFKLAMTVGIIIGTFSSVYVAAALLLYLPPLARPEPAVSPPAALAEAPGG